LDRKMLPAFSAYGTSLCLTAAGAFRPYGSPQGVETRDAIVFRACAARSIPASPLNSHRSPRGFFWGLAERGRVEST